MTRHDTFNPRYGAQTRLAINNFAISGESLPAEFIHALIKIKQAAALSNYMLGLMPEHKSIAIRSACEELLNNFDSRDFPVDVFQTGSGTSTHMNVNEVIAYLANQKIRHNGKTKNKIHANDDVNQCQSSNDIVPSALHMSAACEIHNALRPAMFNLSQTLAATASRYRSTVKTGRTHLMDAMPVRCDQELGAWQAQVDNAIERLDTTFPRICQLALGGTAVGTGINSAEGFAQQTVLELAESSNIPFTQKANLFEGLSCQDTAVELSGQLKVLAVALMKIANDLRLMNSGPYSGLNEIILPELQPGSSIMPGKVNPVIPEAVCMAAAQVMGNDTCITVAGQSGQFQLNVMLPVIAKNLLSSITLLTNACGHLAEKVLQDLRFNENTLEHRLRKNPILIAALNAKLGYDACATIAKEAYRTGEPIIHVAERLTPFSKIDLENLMDPLKLTG